MSSAQSFRTCSNCQFVWGTREEFLRDPEIQMIGYQVNFQDLRAGLFLFNHCCKSTLALEVEKFTDLYTGPIFTESHSGSAECLGYCRSRAELRHCPVQCECAFVRDIMQIIKTYKES